MLSARRFLVLAAVALLLPAATSFEHFDLDRSFPEADTQVQADSVAAIDLWFTQVPQDEATRVRLIDGADELVPTGALVQSEEDQKAFSLPLEGSLAPGDYKVTWRSMAADGHAVSGDFTFQIGSN